MYNKEWFLAQVEKKRALIKSLSTGRCRECDSVVDIHYHHVDSAYKIRNISEILTYSDEKIVEELKKCVELCCNCHKAKHAALHGSLGMYSHNKCRCQLCRNAWNEACKRWKKKYRLKSTGSSIGSSTRPLTDRLKVQLLPGGPDLWYTRILREFSSEASVQIRRGIRMTPS